MRVMHVTVNGNRTAAGCWRRMAHPLTCNIPSGDVPYSDVPYSDVLDAFTRNTEAASRSTSRFVVLATVTSPVITVDDERDTRDRIRANPALRSK